MTEAEISKTAHDAFFDLGRKARLEGNQALAIQLRRRIRKNLIGSASIYMEFAHGWRTAKSELSRQGDLFAL